MKSNQDRPENFDEEIDAALKMLGETAPPEAMVSRVHRSLETAGTDEQRTNSGRLFWIPAGCVAIAAVLLLVFSQARWAKQTSPVAPPAKLVQATPASREMAASRLAPASVAHSSRQKQTLQALVVRRRKEHPHDRHVANLFNYPPTKQERLLMRFAETASPADLQILNPEYQTQVEAQQEAEFSAYLKSVDGSNTQETEN